jgi:endoglycosylceramidase
MIRIHWLLLFSLTMALFACAIACGGPGGSGGSGHPADDDADDDDADDDAADDDAADDDAASPDDDTAPSDDDVVADDDTTPDDDTAETGYVPLFDEAGRQIILHGTAYSGMEFGWFDYQPADFAQIAGWGFDVVRLPIGWAYLEPEFGSWDDGYLTDVVDRVVGYAHDAGLRVILDMHQWHWCTDAGGCGMPNWTCADYAGLPQPESWILASGDFFQHPDYLDEFVAAWDRVAAYFADDERIWAFELWNEPLAGARSLPWFCENQLFRPLFERLIAAIRAHDQHAYIVIEPAVTNQWGFPYVMKSLPDDRLVYAPHLYPLFTSIGQQGYVFPKSYLQFLIDKAQREADAAALPFLLGEWGMSAQAERVGDYVTDVTAMLDQLLAHDIFWNYARDDNNGLLNPDGSEKTVFLDALSRPYPTATTGRLVSFGFDPATRVFRMDFTNSDAGPPATEIYVPAARHYPNGFAVSSSDAAGAWSWTFDAAAQKLTVVADPNAEEHEITIAPASGR